MVRRRAKMEKGTNCELRASSYAGRGHRLLQAAPLTKNRDLGARLLVPRLKRLRKTLFRRPQLGDAHVGPDALVWAAGRQPGGSWLRESCLHFATSHVCFRSNADTLCRLIGS